MIIHPLIILFIIQQTIEIHSVNININELLKREKRLTCFTCDGTSNDACNQLAIDEPCDTKDYKYCVTIVESDAIAENHLKRNYKALIQNNHQKKDIVRIADMENVKINKKCSKTCQIDIIGCHEVFNDVDGKKIRRCISCCNRDYCNIDAPYDIRQSVRLSRQVIESNSNFLKKNNIILMSNVLLFIFFRWL
ncbi:hypothetical protein SNEBB_000016 [Seison nebaliae]|nr:hypothetical protein SNEBB_000016 [Seison nebaliae]